MGRKSAINPKTGRRFDWEAEQAAKRASEVDDASLQQQIGLLKRQQKALEARERFLPFIKFTMPDPEDPGDVERSSYRDARHHRASARVLEEVEKGEIKFLIFTMPPRHGKQVADDTPVLTTRGWRSHGELQVGDHVFGIDGHPAAVMAVAPPLPQDVEVTLTDGTIVHVHENHEWTVWDRSCGAERTVETKYLENRKLWNGPLGARGGRATFQLPERRALQMPDAVLPIDPYALGVWLGDGKSSDPVICWADNDDCVARAVNATYPFGATWRHKTTGVNYATMLNIRSTMARVGVLGDKHIPDAYFIASDEQRLALMAGLIDTDGHVDAATQRVRIATVSERLATDIGRLAATLGWRANWYRQAPTTSTSGIIGRRPVVYVSFTPTRPIPTVIERKRITGSKNAARAVGIAGIRRTTVKVGRCIQVDREDGLYLVGDSLVPTHNSEQVSRRFPAWFIGRHPEQNIVVATYNDDFASDFGKDVRGIMATPQYKQVFPNVKLQRGGAASDRLQTTRGGLLSFVGRGGSLTGRGAHVLICDDLIKDDKEAQSLAIRDQAWSWFTKVAMTRRMGHKLVILTFTRWHSDDPIGRLTDPENPHYNEALASKIKIINFPAIAEDDDPLDRAPGEPLWPELYGLEFLEEQRALDPMGFAALYQQRPSLMDGDLFKREDIRFYTELPEELRFYASSDHAVSTKQRRDPSCFLKVGIDRHSNIYIVDCIWRKMAADVAVEAMLAMCRGNMVPLLWWAEKGHISKSIGPFLRKRMLETGTYINIREVTPVADKVQRAGSIVGRVAMGKVFFPKNAPWVEKAIAEMMGFPNGLHDDFVDALAWIGVGLQSQFGPGTSKSADKMRDQPEFGTLAWVKLQDKWAASERATSSAGGF